MDVVVADNDIHAPRNLIKAQHDITGEPADGIAEHIPDIGHVSKDCNRDILIWLDHMETISLRKNSSTYFCLICMYNPDQEYLRKIKRGRGRFLDSFIVQHWIRT